VVPVEFLRRPLALVRRTSKVVGVPGLAVAAVGLALLGGAVSGWIEQGPSTSAGVPVTASTVAPTSTTSSTTVAADDPVGQLKQQIVDDLGADLTAQRLDPDLRHRRALALSPAAIAFRQASIAAAWAPDQVARIESDYTQLVLAHASNPTVPSVVDATFIVTRWESAAIDGTTARAVVVGHFRLHEPGNVAAQALGGYVQVFDRTWTVAATLSGGRWRMEGRTSA